MNQRALRRAFIIFHLTLAGVVFIQSVLTLIRAVNLPAENHLQIIMPWIAGIEALAALIFLIPRTLRIGGVILLLVFAAAIALHGVTQQLTLLVYAAGVVFVMAHGSAFKHAPTPEAAA